MKRAIILTMVGVLLLGIVFAAVGCQKKTTQQQTTESSEQMYQKAISYIMDLDSALNANMAYIAVHYEREVSGEDKQTITTILETYGAKVFEAELESLFDTEYSDENGNLHGIHINLNIEFSEDVTFSFMKYRTGTGAISTSFTMSQNEKGEWELEESDEPMSAS